MFAGQLDRRLKVLKLSSYMLGTTYLADICLMDHVGLQVAGTNFQVQHDERFHESILIHRHDYSPVDADTMMLSCFAEAWQGLLSCHMSLPGLCWLCCTWHPVHEPRQQRIRMVQKVAGQQAAAAALQKGFCRHRSRLTGNTCTGCMLYGVHCSDHTFFRRLYHALIAATYC